MQTALHILVAAADAAIQQTVSDYLRYMGHRHEKVGSGVEALRRVEEGDFDLVLLDLQLPWEDPLALVGELLERRPAVVVCPMAGPDEAPAAVEALKLGAADYLNMPVKVLELDGLLQKAWRFREMLRDREALRAITRRADAGGVREATEEYVGVSPSSREVRTVIRRMVEARCDAILLLGETGTGKEVVARAIHGGADAEAPFIAVNCPSVPAELFESEFFGYERGAFTGAVGARAGAFEMADGGTLFLDEVADLSSGGQAKLLRVLEARRLRRVGGTREIRVDLRVIAATNCDLHERVEEGAFRRDLYYRLNVHEIRLLPLRRRPVDIVPMALHFLALYGAARGQCFDGFAAEAKQRLLDYDYPGNARQLRNIVERAAVAAGNGQIQAEHLDLPDSAPRRLRLLGQETPYADPGPSESVRTG